MQTVQDDTMAVPGFEHHTFMCSSCDDVEHRLVFARPIEQTSPEAVRADAAPVHAVPVDAVPVYAAPSISPAATMHAHASAPGMFRRVLSKLRGG